MASPREKIPDERDGTSKVAVAADNITSPGHNDDEKEKGNDDNGSMNIKQEEAAMKSPIKDEKPVDGCVDPSVKEEEEEKGGAAAAEEGAVQQNSKNEPGDNKKRKREEKDDDTPTASGAAVKTEDVDMEVDDAAREDDDDDGIPPEYESKWDDMAKKRYRKLKQRFEEERDEILGNIPDSVKDLFGQVGFTKWGKFNLPVLVRSPYDVSPGDVRDIWFDMYNKLQKANRLKSATLLVYWYGASKDLANAFSLIPVTKFIQYEAGLKKGYNSIEPAVQKKLDSGKATKAEKQRAEGLEELQKDLQKPPKERCGYLARDWTEIYVEMADESDEDDVTFADDPDYIPKAKRGKKKPRRNSGKQKAPVKKEEPPEATDEKPPPKKKGKPGRKKKVATKDEKKGELSSEMILDDINDIGDKDTDDESGQRQAAGAEVVAGIEPPVEEKGKALTFDEEMAFLEGDLSSHSDKDDEAMSITSEEDEDDEDYDEEGESSKKKAKRPTDKSDSTKKKPRTKRGKKPPSIKSLIRKEQKVFTDLEQRFGKVVEVWKLALQTKEGDKVESCLKKLLDHVDSFSAPFIEEFRLAELLKTSKKSGLNIPSRKELWNKMKVLYPEKKKDVPEGFKAKRGLGKKRKSTNKSNPRKESGVTDIKKQSRPNKEEREVAPSDRDLVPDPVRKDGGNLSRTGSLNQISKQDQQEVAPVKPEKKKKFSLGTLMRPSAAEEKTEGKSEPAQATTDQVDEEDQLPDWISKPPTGTEPTDSNRLFALEFLQQAVCFIPKNENSSHDCIARSIEMAVYEWSKDQGSEGNFDLAATDLYWEKIHTLVACISGRNRAGSLAAMIGRGAFKSATDIVKLKDEALECSFESKPIIL